MFSELVDDVVARTRRPDMQADIIGYANATIRECQALALFWRDLVEDQLTPNAAPYTWDLPLNFFRLKAAQYGLTGCKPIYPERLPPGRVQEDKQFYYYFATSYVVFNGMGGLSYNGTFPVINLAYYVRQLSFKYYLVGARPAVFDSEDLTWTYLGGITDPILQAAARAKVANWLLQFWRELIAEGTCAKAFKIIGDPKAPSSFALFKSMQTNLLAMEQNEAFDEIAR